MQAAYNAASNGNTIQSGYNCDHSTNTGKTISNGNMTISDGKVTIENLKLQ